MSSYIKYMFKYLFQSDDDYPAELVQPSVGQVSAEHQPSNNGLKIVHLDLHDDLSSYGAGGWLNKRPHCLGVARLLAREAHFGNTVRSLSELETLWGAQINANRARWNASASNVGQQRDSPNPESHLRRAEEEQVSGEQLHDCFNQIQMHDYYAGYDIFIGLRIASTLTILFVVFILFVIYKTNCAESRSSLALPSVREKERRRRTERARERRRLAKTEPASELERATRTGSSLADEPPAGPERQSGRSRSSSLLSVLVAGCPSAVAPPSRAASTRA